MTKIYLVRAFGGQYDDRWEHPVKAWSKESDAKNHVSELEKMEELNIKDHNYDQSFFEYDEIDLD